MRFAAALRLLIPITTAVVPGCFLRSRPPVQHPGGSPAGIWHRVQPGETVRGIAGRYGIPQDDILEINGIADADRIAEGRELFIPGARNASQEAPMAAPAAPRPTRMRWPVPGRTEISSRFGQRWGRMHEGIDIAAPTGARVVAAAPGKVIYSGKMRGYGNVVLIQHADRLVTVYAHNDENLVDEGDEVAAGDELARVGQTGKATGPHLHFEVRRGVLPLDPSRYLEAN